jgi:hypothetical protein
MFSRISEAEVVAPAYIPELNDIANNLAQLAAVIVSRYEAAVLQQASTQLSEIAGDDLVVEDSRSLGCSRCWEKIVQSFRCYAELLFALHQKEVDEAPGLGMLEQWRLGACTTMLSLSSFLLNFRAAAGYEHKDLDEPDVTEAEVVPTILAKAVGHVASHISVGYLSFVRSILHNRVTSVGTCEHHGKLLSACLELMLRALSLKTFEDEYDSNDALLQESATSMFEAILVFGGLNNMFTRQSGSNPNGSAFVLDSNSMVQVLENPWLCTALITALHLVLERVTSTLAFTTTPNPSNAEVTLSNPEVGKSSSKKRRRKSDDSTNSTDSAGTSAIVKMVNELSELEDRFRVQSTLIASLGQLLPLENLVSSALSCCAGGEIGATLRGIVTQLAGILSLVCRVPQQTLIVLQVHVDEYLSGAAHCLYLIMIRLRDCSKQQGHVGAELYASALIDCLGAVQDVHAFIAKGPQVSACEPLVRLMKLTVDLCVSSMMSTPSSADVTDRTSELVLIEQVGIDACLNPIMEVLSAVAVSASPSSPRSASSPHGTSTKDFDAGSAGADQDHRPYFLVCCELAHTLCNSVVAWCADTDSRESFHLSMVHKKLVGLLQVLVKVLEVMNDESTSTVNRSYRWLSSFGASSVYRTFLSIESAYGIVSVLAASCLRAVSSISTACRDDHENGAVSSDAQKYAEKLFPVNYKHACMSFQYAMQRTLDLEHDEEEEGARSIYAAMFAQDETAMTSQSLLDAKANSCGWLCLLGTCLSLHGLSQNDGCSSEGIVHAVKRVLDHVACVESLLTTLHQTKTVASHMGAILNAQSFIRQLSAETAVGICFRGLVSYAVATNNTALLSQTAALTNCETVHVEHPNRFLSLPRYSYKTITGSTQLESFKLSLSTGYLEALLLAFHDNCLSSSINAVLCEELVSLSAFVVGQVSPALCSAILSGNDAAELRCEHIHRVLKLLLCGFQCIRLAQTVQNTSRRDANVDDGADEKVATPSFKEMAPRWCSCTLQTIIHVLVFMKSVSSSATVDTSNRILTLVLSLIDVIVQQSKFSDTLSASMGLLTQLFHNSLLLIVGRVDNVDIMSLYRSFARSVSVCSNNFELKKHAHLLIASIVSTLSSRAVAQHMTPAQLACVSNGLFPLLDRCKPREKKQMYALLDSNGKILLDEIHANYMRDYKFTGKA